MYYNYNKSFLSDYYYDQMSHQLVELQKEYDSQKGKSVKKDTRYGYVMHDFDGSTGFDLYNKLNEEDEKDLLMNCGYKLYREEKKNDNQKKKSMKSLIDITMMKMTVILLGEKMKKT